MTLPTTKTKPTTDLAKQSILLYGVPKLGKSSFASQFPEAMFFECEPGLNHLEVFKLPTYSWEAFLEACKLLAKGDHNFKTIVIDTVDNAFKMCSDYVGTNGGAVDPATAADAVLSYYRSNQRDLIPFLQVDGEYINEKHALVTASINKTKLDPVSFNTTGASTFKRPGINTPMLLILEERLSSRSPTAQHKSCGDETRIKPAFSGLSFESENQRMLCISFEFQPEAFHHERISKLVPLSAIS
jgi:hypothetical protein